MILKSLITLITTTGLFATTAIAQADDENHSSGDTKHSNRVAPVKSIYALGLMHVTEDNIGFGISYEHFLDKKGIMSLYLPVSYALPSANLSNYYIRNEDYYNGYYPGQDTRDEFSTPRGMVNFYPGIKIYPGTAHKKVTYAIGTSLLIGIGNAQTRTLDYRIDTINNNGYNQYKQVLVKDESASATRFRMGMLITNFINIRPDDRYYLGLEFGIGYSYFNNIGGKEDVRTALVQLGLKVGLSK